MKFNLPTRYVLAIVASLVLAACGGGGAQTNPNQGGLLSLLPTTATFYAGVPYTMTISGGRAPYSLTSNEPSVLPVPSTVNGNTFQVVGANPGVIDTGLPAGALPIKTVTISARDSSGLGPVTATIQVGQNFLTSYAVSFGTTTCPPPTGSAATVITPCAGGDTVMTLDAVISGNKVGDALFQFDVVTGTMGFVNPIGSNTVTQTFQATSDHQGIATAIVRVPAGTPSQIGMIRVTHVASGVSNTFSFLITPGAVSALAALPSTFTFTGSSATTCGTGSGDFFVTGGTPPYAASSSNPFITVVAKDANAGHFTLTATNAATPCIAGASIVVTDSGGSTPVTVSVTTTTGTSAPATALAAQPTAITLTCGGTSSVAAVGGSGSYTATTTNALATTSVSGNTVSVTLAGVYAAGAFPSPQSLNITDGSSAVSVALTAPASCP
ncbi:MAG TPA: hypothetical protein VLT60_09785 [Usitatibacter sp.]|nr:hypothetical protein [Usitatibacter sp.]